MSLINIEVATNALGLEKPAHALVKAIAQGIGATFYPWQKSRETRADIDAFAAWKHELSKLGTGTAQLDLSLSQRTELRLRIEEERFQINREAIAEESVKAFKSLPIASHDQRSAEIDDDWLDHFWRHAERVSVDDLRTLWGKVLARQAAGATNISARALSFLSTLSRSEAALIEAVAEVAIGSLDGHKPAFALVDSMAFLADSGSMKDRAGSENARINDLGLQHYAHANQWSDLDAIGVLSQSGWAYEAFLPVSDKGAHLSIGKQKYLICDGLVRVHDALVAGQFRFGSGMKFSPLGAELLSIVDVQPNAGFLSKVESTVAGFGLRLVSDT
ncbi:DUF2806 domain-containing protein [Devosia rhizoryzae]|uniref:DUF2806 domain-containing protein n=1 Tax=Devosia rhizoryzae TaxID=2774137 RepID=A0ABX7C4I4_9HYPH|nr:DUF2806 domain-containing protein [Devosia rhizoryzae]QQR39155.1 DUF2806 domain-containing protein [Devosia rhizoryzae]